MHITEAISFTNTPTFNIDALQRRVSPLSIIPYVPIHMYRQQTLNNTLTKCTNNYMQETYCIS